MFGLLLVATFVGPDAATPPPTAQPAEDDLPRWQQELPPPSPAPPEKRREPPPVRKPPSKKERPIVFCGCAPLPRGRLGKRLVQRQVRSRLSGLRWCYQATLQRDPTKLQVRVELDFRVDVNGRVTAVAATTEDRTAATLLRCIEKRVRQWRFPAIENGHPTRVRYPIRFSGRR